MTINPAAPGRTFQALWDELTTVLPPGSVVKKYYGRRFKILAVTDLKVTLDSSDVNGVQDIPKQTFETVYADWRNYRYENLSHTNPQDVLHVISIIDHVVQTWVRREQRTDLISKARKAGIPDGVFWVLHYNELGRITGPSPNGEPVALNEVFPDQPASLLSEFELAASQLFEASNMLSDFISTKDSNDVMSILVAKHPGFGKDVYSSVVGRACYIAMK